MTRGRQASGGFAVVEEPLTGRPIHRARAANGIEVHVLPMPGFVRAHASLTARYGSRDTRLPDGTPLPDGTAHFLEHRMFQGPAGDVFDLYAARGASANAYTTFDHTCYLFDCTTRFEENLATLLETLRAFHQDPAGIDREREIIGQEIAMYADDPTWRGYFHLLEALYVMHPVRRDIAGTRRSIAPIDGALLERVHRHWYRPGNLVFVAAGNLDPQMVLSAVESAWPAPRRRDARGVRRARCPEPRAVHARNRRIGLPVDRASVYLGLKDAAPGGGRIRTRRQVDALLALELLCGDGGRVQRRLYDEGLIDPAFHGAYEDDRDHAFAVIYAEVDDASAYRRRLTDLLAEAVRSPFTDAEVERARRVLIGRQLRRFHAPAQAAEWLLDVALADGMPGDGLTALRGASGARVTRRARDLVAAPRSWSVVVPRG